MMKRGVLTVLIFLVMLACAKPLKAQCSICTKTAMQQGEKSAGGLNTGIIYLMLTPFAVVGYIGYRWYKTEKHFLGGNNNSSQP